MILSSLRLRIALGALLLAMVAAESLALAQDLPAVPSKRVALLVGINDYLKPGLSKLRFAENDVKELADELANHGFTVNVLLGSGQGAKHATRGNILASARSLVKTLGKNDLALVMLSGHGQQIVLKKNNGESSEEAFFVPYEGIAGRPETLVPLNELIDDILAPNVGRKLLLVDACRDVSKVAGRGVKGVQGNIARLPEDTAIFFACRSGQQSYEEPTLKHGLFSWCLLEGLKGKAAREGEVSWTDLLSHVQRRMNSNELKKYVPEGEMQNPISAGGVGYTILAKIVPLPAPDPELPSFAIKTPPIRTNPVPPVEPIELSPFDLKPMPPPTALSDEEFQKAIGRLSNPPEATAKPEAKDVGEVEASMVASDVLKFLQDRGGPLEIRWGRSNGDRHANFFNKVADALIDKKIALKKDAKYGLGSEISSIDFGSGCFDDTYQFAIIDPVDQPTKPESKPLKIVQRLTKVHLWHGELNQLFRTKEADLPIPDPFKVPNKKPEDEPIPDPFGAPEGKPAKNPPAKPNPLPRIPLG